MKRLSLVVLLAFTAHVQATVESELTQFATALNALTAAITGVPIPTGIDEAEFQQNLQPLIDAGTITSLPSIEQFRTLIDNLTQNINFLSTQQLSETQKQQFEDAHEKAQNNIDRLIDNLKDAATTVEQLNQAQLYSPIFDTLPEATIILKMATNYNFNLKPLIDAQSITDIQTLKDQLLDQIKTSMSYFINPEKIGDPKLTEQQKELVTDALTTIKNNIVTALQQSADAAKTSKQADQVLEDIKELYDEGIVNTKYHKFLGDLTKSDQEIEQIETNMNKLKEEKQETGPLLPLTPPDVTKFIQELTQATNSLKSHIEKKDTDYITKFMGVVKGAKKPESFDYIEREIKKLDLTTLSPEHLSAITTFLNLRFRMSAVGLDTKALNTIMEKMNNLDFYIKAPQDID